MTNAKNTKKALLLSVLSLLVCFSMLLGTTFAWFTDSVTSANNIIKSGNLDIELEYWDGTAWVDVEGKSDILTNTLWEPGVVEVAYLRVANAGSLELKYQLGINIVSETAGKNVAGDEFLLSDYIQFGVVENVNGETGAYANREAAVAVVTDAKIISAGYAKAASMASEDELYLALVVYMPTTVGNDANHDGTNVPEINLGINVFATQAEAESDAFGKDYDTGAVVIATSQSVALPTVGSGEPVIDQTITTPIDNNVTLTLPAELLTNLAQVADAPQSVALSHAEPRIDVSNNIITFDHIELVDENGEVIDLEALNNDKPITVKFNVGDAFNVGDTVIVYHDGEIFATPEVDADKNITYTATHFCEVTVGYNDGKIDDLIELENTIKNASDGDTIVFGGDITSEDGILINNKNLTIDLGGYTFTVSKGSSTSNRNFKIIGTSVVTIKNGTIIAGDSVYGTVRTEGQANATLENLQLYNKLGGGLNVKAVTGTTVTINNCEIYSQYGGGVEASGGNVVLNNTKIEQKGVYDNGWYSVAMEINGGGTITVNSGEYSGSAIATDANAKQGNCVAFILSSGGTLTINGGTFNGVVAETANASNFCGLIYADRAAVVNIYGGTFNSNGAILDMRNNAGTQPNPKATIYGGTFSADPTVSGLYSSNLIKLADGCQVIDNEGSYIVGKPVATADELATALKAGGNIVLCADIAMESIYITNPNFVLDGNGYTITQTGTNTYALIDTQGGSVTLKNVTFDGIVEGAVVRTVDAKFYAFNVTVQNSNHTQQQGLFRLVGESTIENCVFKNNICSMAITLNYDGPNNDPQVVENCVFENNTCNSIAVLYYVKGAGCTVNGNKFMNNTVNTSGNAATVYMGFTENNVITNNVFSGNDVTGTSKRVAGGLMIGYDAVIKGNSFVDNTVTGSIEGLGNDVCASVYYTDIDLSGNYWGGSAPVANDDYYQEYTNHSVIIDDYLTTFEN